MTLLTTSDVCEILATRHGRLPAKTLDNWCRAGMIRPVGHDEGRGRHRRYSVMDVLALAAGQGLRSNGYDMSVAGKVASVIAGITEDDLLAAFRGGRTCLMIVGQEVSPVLLSRSAILDNPEHIDYEAAEAIGLSPSALDLRRLYDRIQSRLRELRLGRSQSADAQ